MVSWKKCFAHGGTTGAQGMWLQQQFEVEDVEETAKFEADFFEAGHLTEAEVAVEGYAGVVFAGDAGYEGACAGGATVGDKTLHECAAYAATLRPVGEVDGCLECATVGGTLFPGMGVAIAVDCAAGLVDDVGVGSSNLLHAACHLGHGYGFGRKRDGGVEDVVVIYVGQRGDVALFYGSYHRRGYFCAKLVKMRLFCRHFLLYSR